jgi:hypothetical protein
MSDDDNKLPRGPVSGFSEKKFITGSKRSQRRLKTLGFDPIERLVKLYKRLEEEDEYMVNLRQVAAVTELNPDGSVKKSHKYSGVAHMAVFGHMEKTASDLLRYDYGRVPELIPTSAADVKPLMIQLTDEGTAPIVITAYKRDDEAEDAEYTEIDG